MNSRTHSQTLASLVILIVLAVPLVARGAGIPAPDELLTRFATLEQEYLAGIQQKQAGEPARNGYGESAKELFLALIRGLKQDSPEGSANFQAFLVRVRSSRPPAGLAYSTVAKYLSDKLKIDLTVCQGLGKPADVTAKIQGYLQETAALCAWLSAQHAQLVDRSDSAPASPSKGQAPLRRNNTTMDRIRNFFKGLKETLGAKAAAPEVFSTYEGARRVFQAIKDQVVEEVVPLDSGLGNRATFGPKPPLVGKVSLEFFPTSNNVSDQFSQGAAFAKLKELIARTQAARQNGITKGVFILIHNFILSGEETARKMADLLIAARQAGVPILLSYDQFGTHVYASGALPVIARLKKARIGVLSVKPFQGERMDHRKIYFFGTGDRHVIAMSGGQGWCDQYGGPDWDKIAPVSEKDGCLLYPAGQEPWVDHMRLLDGEAALQGAIGFLARYSHYADRETLATGLDLDTSDPGQVGPRLWDIFYPELEPAGNLTAVILTNVSWDQRPLTEAWYKNLSDPDVQDIRIAQPYITDPVFRTRLKQAVRDGKNLKILIPGVSDNFLSQFATKYLFVDLREIHVARRAAGQPVGTLEMREWQSGQGKPQMLHMKYGIFIHRTDSTRDLVIDGSYNATAVEARAGEVNADIVLMDHRATIEAAATFDDYFNRASPSEFSRIDKLRGAPVAFILRPFM